MEGKTRLPKWLERRLAKWLERFERDDERVLFAIKNPTERKKSLEGLGYLRLYFILFLGSASFAALFSNNSILVAVWFLAAVIWSIADFQIKMLKLIAQLYSTLDKEWSKESPPGLESSAQAPQEQTE